MGSRACDEIGNLKPWVVSRRSKSDALCAQREYESAAVISDPLAFLAGSHEGLKGFLVLENWLGIVMNQPEGSAEALTPSSALLKERRYRGIEGELVVIV